MVFDGLIESFLELALSIAEYISQGVYSIVSCLFYPVQVIFYWMDNIITLIWIAFIDLLTAWWGIFDIMYAHVSTSIVSFIPSMWSVIILLGLTIVFTLRLYYFIKDISILGFKI